MNIEQIYELITKEVNKELVKLNEPMSKHTSFKIGGMADIFVTVKTEKALEAILKIIKEQNVPLTIIGNGSNLLVKDNGIRGLVAKIDLDEITIEKQNNEAIVELGAGLKNGILAQKLLNQQIAGFEFAAGIPGTIGGAVYMNAGAYGSEMKDIVQEVTYIDKNLEYHTINNEECKFDYRTSIFTQKDVIITKVKLKLPYGNQEEIKQKMEENSKSRNEKQPVQMPSAGSTFKRGSDFITAKLIDECGLKGYKIGGAEVSTMHAGFVVNTGRCNSKWCTTISRTYTKNSIRKMWKTNRTRNKSDRRVKWRDFLNGFVQEQKWKDGWC